MSLLTLSPQEKDHFKIVAVLRQLVEAVERARGITLEAFGGGTDAAAARNTSAFSQAIAALTSAGGGVIRLGAGTYEINTLDAITVDGIFVEGEGPDCTTLKFLTHGTTSALEWAGTLGTAYTLNADVAAGAYQIVLTSVVGLAVGDYLYIVSNTLAAASILTSKIVAISGSTVKLFDAVPYDIATIDDYDINIIAHVVGGGIRNLTVDGSALSIVEAGQEQYLVFFERVRGCVIENIAFTNYAGALHGSSLLVDSSHSCRIVGLRAIQTTRINPVLWFFGLTACSIDDLVVEGSSLFTASRGIFAATGLYASSYCAVGKVAASGSFERAVKHVANWYCTFDSTIVSGNSYDTAMNGIVLSSATGCTFGQLIAVGIAGGGHIGIWIANSEGLFNNNSIGQIVAEHNAIDVLFDTLSGDAVGSTGNYFGSIIASAITNNIDSAFGTIGSINGIPLLPIYAKAALPPATLVGQQSYVSDEAGGAVPAFADGTNWRRVTDRAVVS